MKVILEHAGKASRGNYELVSEINPAGDQKTNRNYFRSCSAKGASGGRTKAGKGLLLILIGNPKFCSYSPQTYDTGG